MSDAAKLSSSWRLSCVCDSSRTTVGIWRMLVSTAKPKRNSWMSGMSESEEERAGVADDVRELFAADGQETVEEGVHFAASMIW